MSLPLNVIERLFARLTLTYGRAFMAQWDGLPPADVKTIWADELSFYADRLDSVAWALANLPERVPNTIAFRNLCRQAPAPAVPALPEPKADPERVKAELSKLAPLRNSTASAAISAHDGKAWARRIMARQADGDRLNPYTLSCAQQALRQYSTQAGA